MITLKKMQGLHEYGDRTVVAALARAEHMLQSAGPLTEIQQAQIDQRTQQFLQTVLAIEADTAREMIAWLQQYLRS